MTFGTLAKSNAATPSVARTAGIISCSTTYCHGAKMLGGDTTGTNKTPSFNNATYLPATMSSAACGTCHGFPPSTASGHPGSITIPAGFPTTATIGTTCSCHNTINTAGNSYANIFSDKMKHINGISEYSSACDTCHDYDTTGGGTTWGKTNYGGNNLAAGAHAKHIQYIKTRWNIVLAPATDTFGTGNAAAVCGVCHTNTLADHSMGDATQPRSILFALGGRSSGGVPPTMATPLLPPPRPVQISTATTKPRQCGNHTTRGLVGSYKTPHCTSNRSEGGA